MTVPAGIHYRALRPADCAALGKMLPSVLAGNWSQEQLLNLLTTAHSCRVLCEATPSDEALLGFAEFMVVADEAELLALAIDAEVQGCGLGRALLSAVLDEMRTNGCTRCHLEVRRSNEAAIALYTGQGFELSGIRKGYYPAGPGQQAPEDALLYSLTLRAAPASP